MVYLCNQKYPQPTLYMDLPKKDRRQTGQEVEKLQYKDSGRALLESSQMQITEIAYAVGFTTVKSFTMNFKAEYGITPSEFRQQGQ